MYAIVRKDSKVEGSGDARSVSVNRVRVTSAEQAKRAGVVLAEKPLQGGGLRVVTCDGQKLDFDAKGKMIAGGTEDKEEKRDAGEEGAASYRELQERSQRVEREREEQRRKDAEAEEAKRKAAEEEAKRKQNPS